MKNYLNKGNRPVFFWHAAYGSNSRKDIEAGLVRTSQLKKISSYQKSHHMTKSAGVVR